jgi:hypothetical protein
VAHDIGLRANPDVVFGGIAMHAAVVDDEAERDRLWRLADRVFPAFASYRRDAARANRKIPIVQLTPIVLLPIHRARSSGRQRPPLQDGASPAVSLGPRLPGRESTWQVASNPAFHAVLMLQTRAPSNGAWV